MRQNHAQHTFLAKNHRLHVVDMERSTGKREEEERAGRGKVDRDVRVPVREREGDARNGTGGKMGETGDRRTRRDNRGAGGRRVETWGPVEREARTWGNRYAVLSETTADVRHVPSGQC